MQKFRPIEVDLDVAVSVQKQGKNKWPFTKHCAKEIA
jgi:hypothetical protein